MTTLTPAQRKAQADARHADGTFGEQHHADPETKVSPKQLGMIGLGPTSKNVFAEPLDREEWRPLRPYLPLTPADDDEFFDAPEGSYLVLSTEVGKQRRFVLEHDDRYGHAVWGELAEHREVVVRSHEPGDLWATMFADDGRMHSARLSLPAGMLHSDRDGFIDRHEYDTPIEWEEAMHRLAVYPNAVVVSRSQFGDERTDGVPEGLQGKVTVDVREDGYLKLTGPGRGANRAVRALHMSKVDVFDRDGDIVLRHEQDPGFGWEEVLRPAR